MGRVFFNAPGDRGSIPLMSYLMLNLDKIVSIRYFRVVNILFVSVLPKYPVSTWYNIFLFLPSPIYFLSIYACLCSYMRVYLIIYNHVYLIIYIYVCVCVCVCLCVHVYICITDPSKQEGCNIWSIFKQRLTGLNTRFSFALTGCHYND